ncbi:type II secretion system F family protein [Luteipulveratus sp. YIM 133132]|uniref:type II secretion system F family protein n=1 Tax=Luteipulveratus flavus TaxID=3031728 RepID=UPI0023B0F7C4|nr:type II secretion system F family protein [Luteipulveratus sp. YIM 133132]MDE9366950.1 type II secretion system F family protein [Luteipulveratus sp. YIM 133132]
MLTLAVVTLVAAFALWPARTPGRGLVLPDRAGAVDPPTGPRSGRAARNARARTQAVLQILESVTPAVRAGVPPAQAVALAVRTSTGDDTSLRGDLEEMAVAADAGAELGPLWTDMAGRRQVDGLAEVGRAWTLSDRLGTPLTDALSSATESVRARLEHERRVQVLTAGPRATMQLLTLLPVGGLLLAPLIGVSPAQAYSGPLILLAGLPGVALLLVGRWTVRRMVRSATAERGLV